MRRCFIYLFIYHIYLFLFFRLFVSRLLIGLCRFFSCRKKYRSPIRTQFYTYAHHLSRSRASSERAQTRQGGEE